MLTLVLKQRASSAARLSRNGVALRHVRPHSAPTKLSREEHPWSSGSPNGSVEPDLRLPQQLPIHPTETPVPSACSPGIFRRTGCRRKASPQLSGLQVLVEGSPPAAAPLL